MKAKTPIILSLLVHIVALMTVSSMTQISPALLGRVRLAMATTTQSNVNMTQACSQWDSVMKNADQLPENIRGICYALHASCQTRVGQDRLALQSYQTCLSLNIAQDTRKDATMGKAFCLQRLMKYHDARLAFLDVEMEQRACLGAATCSLRLRDTQGALELLQEYSKRHAESMECKGMLATLMYLQATTKTDLKEAIRMLSICRNVSPLYQWVYEMSSLQQYQANSASRKGGFDFLQLAAVNQSPFDDPLLIQLDDKVLLHALLTNQTDCLADVTEFWPEGYILPREESLLRQRLSKKHNSNGKKEWILKERAGYGSHGNQLVNEREAVELSKKDGSDLYLCQRFVSPPLLLQGYKFTMRLYIVYFPQHVQNVAEVYLCDQGILKIAALPYKGEGATDPRIHMTNSGRDDPQMTQCDLTVLQYEAEKAASWSYQDLWNNIREAVRVVMQTYLNLQRDQALPAVGVLGIPKIMGFDFLVDANHKPFLLEVNRFPGLEPRDASDFSVKQAVVYGAWMLASDRMGIDVNRSVNVDAAPCFFERIV